MLRGKTIGVIGAGNMGGALIKGLIKAKVVPAEHLLVSERNDELIQKLEEDLEIKRATLSKLVEDSDVVILAVKPQDMDKLLSEFRDRARPDQLYISIAAGVLTSTIEAFFAADVPVIRVMPNLPVLVQTGASAYCLGAHASWPHGVVASLIFSSVGIVAEVSEKQMDTVTALSGSGPAYVFLLAEIMTEAGQREGLPKDVAGYLTEHTILGAAKMLSASEKGPKTLRRQVTSPGGTTEAAMKVLEKEGFLDLFCKGVAAARHRSEELSQQNA